MNELGVMDDACMAYVPSAMVVSNGDKLLIKRRSDITEILSSSADNAVIAFTCTTPSVLERVHVGDPIWIDDGKIGTEVIDKNEYLVLQVTNAPPKGMRLRENMGLNFPKTSLQLPTLSDKDYEDLDFVCKHADIIGLSFVESLEDIKHLISELEKRKDNDLPIIAKIETQNGVSNLPEILLGVINEHRFGVMIARGDLAVELGSERMAEIQEEILWICESAHAPVVWATQVLESIAKKGVRSRPELTDAAMGVRAECVMLNKGPYINSAVESLAKVLVKMQDHQYKKFSRMRALHFS